MKIRCVHGYFFFEEEDSGEVAAFMRLFSVTLASKVTHFTFADLIDAPTHSLPGGTFLDAPTQVAFEGSPAEVMRKNGLVYDFSKGLVVPILSITESLKVYVGGDYFVAPGMILPGSVMDDGSRVTDYAAFFDFEQSKFRYSELVDE